MLVISVLAGRITLSRILPVNDALGRIEVAEYLLFAALLIAGGLVVAGQIRIRFSARTIIVLSAVLFFLLSVIGIDAFAHRSVDMLLLDEIGRVLLTVAALFLFLNSDHRFNQILAIIVAVGLTITVGDFVGWRLQRLQLITGLSTSRINLFVLGAAITLYIGTNRAIWLAAILISIFTLFSGSMKISMVAAAAATCILVFTLLSAYRFLDTAKISSAILAGIVLSVITGDINNTLSRVEVVNLAASSAMISSIATADIDPEAAAKCQGTQAPLYCMNPFLIISDSTERLRLFAHAITLIKTAPLLGSGPNAFQLSLWYKTSDQSSLNVYVYPHNLLLDIGVTHGLVGMACLLILLSVCLVIILSTFAETLASVGLLVAAASSFVAALTGGDFYDSRYIYICAMLAAFGAFKSVETAAARH